MFKGSLMMLDYIVAVVDQKNVTQLLPTNIEGTDCSSGAQ